MMALEILILLIRIFGIFQEQKGSLVQAFRFRCFSALAQHLEHIRALLRVFNAPPDLGIESRHDYIQIVDLSKGFLKQREKHSSNRSEFTQP